jgi:predicted RNA-binding protein with PIN domain
MNVIGSRPDGWWEDPDAAVRRLIAELRSYAVATGERVHVVFDRRPREVRSGRHGGVTVGFASFRGRDAADDEIVRIVVDDPDAPSLRVVTSDRRLADRVRRGGASVVSASSFRRRLDSGGDRQPR